MQGPEKCVIFSTHSVQQLDNYKSVVSVDLHVIGSHSSGEEKVTVYAIVC